MKFRKDDLLTTLGMPDRKPLARVTSVTREGVVYCVNLVACSTMKEGHEFHFNQDDNMRYRFLIREGD